MRPILEVLPPNLAAYLPDPALVSVGRLAVFAAAITLITAIYLTPAIVAALRESRWTLAIMTVNLLAGWTVAAWLIALQWAVRSDTDQAAGATPATSPP